MTPEERDEFAELAKTWRTFADEARKQDGKSDAAEGLWAGKCIAYINCAEHLEWFLSTKAKP